MQAAPGFEFAVTKTYTHEVGLSACFRQWRTETHCHFMHGYALQVKVEFAADELDENNWVINFGGLKPLKAWLEDTFDHKTLVAQDDPHLARFEELDSIGIIDMRVIESTGCEAFATMIATWVMLWLEHEKLETRVSLEGVEVREHGGNSAIYRRTI